MSSPERREPRPSGYPAMLEALGHDVVQEPTLSWYRYNGFLRPACLPHATPRISAAEARAALRASGAMFARWEQAFGRVEPASWWHVVRRGPYDLAQLSGNTRSKVRRGAKRLEVRTLSPDEIASHCKGVCRAAVERYNDTEMLPSDEAFAQLARAAARFPQHLEVVGVWRGDVLVGYAENHLDDGAALINTLWYDPSALKDYASYVLMDALLEDYLNRRGFAYVSDGARMLYHRTTVHDFLIDKFGFERSGAELQVVYRSAFRVAVKLAWPLRDVVHRASDRWDRAVLHKARGILVQEGLLRAQAATR